MKYRKQWITMFLAIQLLIGVPVEAYAAGIEMGPAITSEVGDVRAAGIPDTGEKKETKYESNLVLIDYSILSTSGKDSKKIEKEDHINIEITMTNTGIPTSALGDKGNFDFIKTKGSFSGGDTIDWEILSKEDEALLIKVTVQDLIYNGVGRQFPFQVGYKNLQVPYHAQDLTINECSEYQEATPTPTIVPDNKKEEDEKEKAEKDKAEADKNAAAEAEAAMQLESGGVSMGTPVDSETKAPIDGPVPNIIIQNFSYGEEKRIPIGGTFHLNFEFANTSKTKNIENMVVSVEPGEGVMLQSSTNTFYYEILKAKNAQTADVEMQIQPDAKTGAVTVDVNFKYEYVDNGKRTAVTLPGKLSVPIFQPDRLQISAPLIPEEATVGEEISLSMNYVNKGKGEAANVEAVIEGEVDTTLRQQNLGNFEAGKSGTIDFVMTPKKEGELSVVLKISYEDENMKVKTKDFPVKIQVKPAKPKEEEMGMGGMETEPPKSKLPWIGAGILGLLVLSGTIIQKIKKKKLKKTLEPEPWDDEQEEW